MAQVGKALQSEGFLERIEELSEQVVTRCQLFGVAHPRPRDIAREMRLLALARKENGLPSFPLDIVQAAFAFLVPLSRR